MIDDELRIAVAEKLGWYAYTDADGKTRFHNRVTGSDDDEAPAYTTSADAALTLCDALAKEGWSCATLSPPGQDCCVTFYGSDRPHHTATAPTLPLAICRAFLAVKEQKL